MPRLKEAVVLPTLNQFSLKTQAPQQLACDTKEVESKVEVKEAVPAVNLSANDDMLLLKRLVLKHEQKIEEMQADLSKEKAHLRNLVDVCKSVIGGTFNRFTL